MNSQQGERISQQPRGTLLDNLLESKKIILIMGPGGVGKTSLAAVLGLQAAALGRKCLVLTLDPAQRLAAALGLDDIQSGKRVVLSKSTLRDSGVPAKQALCIEMLDAHQAWTAAIEREVVDPLRKKRILEHPFFQRMSQDLVGAREYASTEKLYNLYTHGTFELIILDTPPTVHGVDLLEAPDKILDVLENDAFRWLMRPALLAGKLGLRMLNFYGGYTVRTLSRFVGLNFLKELAEFVDLFSGLLEGFRQRAAAVKALLRSKQTAFVLVTTADPGRILEMENLFRQLRNKMFSPEAIIINRVAPKPPSPKPGWQNDLMAEASAQGIKKNITQQGLSAMLESYEFMSQMAERDRDQIRTMSQRLTENCQVFHVERQKGTLHDLKGLAKLQKNLCSPDQPSPLAQKSPRPKEQGRTKTS
jgi:anion-transporting  ArsA/GET3 family ATPase